MIMAAKKNWKKGKVHLRKMPNGRKQKGRWHYPNRDSKKGRKWKRA